MGIIQSKEITTIANIIAATATTIDKKVNANSGHGNKNRRPGPVNTNLGEQGWYMQAQAPD